MATRALLVANSAAGTADDDLVAAVAAILRKGYDLRIARPDTPDVLTDELTGFAGDRVIVAGGDGSLHLAINVLNDLGRLDDVAVGLVPLGTGNDFGGGIGMPEDPLDAARACLDASPEPVDAVVADDGEHVVNAAHAGIGAVAAEFAQSTKPVAGRLAYPLGAIQAAMSEAGYQVTLRLDGETIHDTGMLFALVANGPRIGGGTTMCPDADPGDGLIDVLVIDSMPLHERAGLGIDIQRGTHLERDDVHYWRGAELHIAGEAVDHNRDGEILHGLADVTYTIRPAAWQLLRWSTPPRTVDAVRRG
jgi:YegS/Rv2252/BmrU family lipid kinase